MLFQDRALIDGPARITPQGHFVARARVARANNVQDYMPREIGMPAKADGTPYRIFRPESEVFAKDSLASALHRPVVIDHPAEDVTAANWKALSVGDTGGDILRDGEFMSIPVMVMDAAGVKAMTTTHREFSWGYSADLDMVPGKFGDAEYDGSIKNVRYNHLAGCRSARGGSDLRVTDALVIIDERPAHLRDHQEPKSMKITIGDAKDVDLSDGAAVALAVGALNTTLTDAQSRATTAETAVATHVATIAARDGEIVTLKQSVLDAVANAKRDEAARTQTMADAKRLAPALTFTDAQPVGEIKRLSVNVATKDASKDFTDAQIDTAFATSVALLGDAASLIVPLGAPTVIGDTAASETARAAMIADMHKPTTVAA